jgi:Prp8 binding protein
MSLVAVSSAAQGGSLVEAATATRPYTRTSSLPAPTMHLTGHSGAVNAAAFSPDGSWLATGGQDTAIFLWDMSSPTLAHNAVLSGHTMDVLQVAWASDSSALASAAADGGALWDVETGARTKRLRHKGVVNSVAAAASGAFAALTGSDDRTAALWEPRCKEPASVFRCPYQVTSVAMSPDSTFCFTGGLDEVVRAWDPRRGGDVPVFTLQGHTGTVTGLAVSGDGTLLLSNGAEGALRTWDARAFCPGGERAVGVYGGLVHDPKAQPLLRCGFSPDGESFVAGSSDGVVNVWDRQTYRLLRQLGGHRGGVNEVAWHPTQPVLASASDDKVVIVGELPLLDEE